jgi:CheY-like chemotaxis protein
MSTTILKRNPHRSLGQSPSVLVVDDDDDIRETLRACLEEEGFLVRTARNGLEALAQLDEEPPPGLILLDLMMPEMNGWEVLEQLRSDRARAAIPVAVMSGSHRGEVHSANYVVPKPFDLGAMVELVREHCDPRTSDVEASSDSFRRRTDRQGLESIETTAA